MQPVDVLAARHEIRRHGEFARVVFAVVKHALVANAAFNGKNIEVDALGLNFAVAQRLKIIVLVEGDGES